MCSWVRGNYGLGGGGDDWRGRRNDGMKSWELLMDGVEKRL